MADRQDRTVSGTESPNAASLLRRTYTDQGDGLWMDFPSPEAEPFFATCGYCGWDGPSRETRQEAERDRWRHPDVLCWLRALWFDYGPRRLA